jgi:hypothetical protein
MDKGPFAPRSAPFPSGGPFAVPFPSGPVEKPSVENAPVEFSRGMIAEFELTSETNPQIPHSKEMFVQFFSGLKDARKQQAKITIHSQDFQVCSVPISNFWDKAKRRWNRFAYKINSKFDKQIPNPYLKRATPPDNPGQAMLDNAPMIIQGDLLPTFLTLEDKLMTFVALVKHNAQQSTEPNAPTEPTPGPKP